MSKVATQQNNGQQAPPPILAFVETAENFIHCALAPAQLPAVERLIGLMLAVYGNSKRAVFHANHLQNALLVKRCELIANVAGSKGWEVVNG